MKKQLNNEELENVSGGDVFDTCEPTSICKYCGATIFLNDTEKMRYEKECDHYYEYKCPECGIFQKCDVVYNR